MKLQDGTGAKLRSHTLNQELRTNVEGNYLKIKTLRIENVGKMNYKLVTKPGVPKLFVLKSRFLLLISLLYKKKNYSEICTF